MRPLRVVDLNTWIGCVPRGFFGVTSLEPPGQKGRRFDALVAEVKAREVDVLLLQECLPMPSFAVQLARRLGYDVLWRVANGGLRMGGWGLPTGIGRGEGLAILARPELRLTPIGERKLSGAGFVTNWCSFQLGPVRLAIAARVQWGGRSVIVVSSHIRYGFPSREAFFAGWAALHARGVARHPTPPAWLARLTKGNDEARDKELRRLARWLLKLRQGDHGAPIILGADFNLDPEAPQVGDFVASTGYLNALPDHWPGILTWDPLNNVHAAAASEVRWPDGRPKSAILQLMAYLDGIPQCPDHLLVSPGIEVAVTGRAFDAPVADILASDHYGIWADVTPLD